MFRKKTKTYHAAAGEASLYRVQAPSLQTDRVTPIIYEWEEAMPI
jgi:hypothetical protein